MFIPLYRKYHGRNTNQGTGSAGLSPQAIVASGYIFTAYRDKTQVEWLLNALLAGNVNTGTANNYGTNTNYWSSSSNSSDNAWNRNLNYNNTGANRNNNNKYNYFSVRCKK